MTPAARILFWSSNLWQLGMGLLGPLFAVFATEIGGNIFDIAWVWALYMVVTGVGIILVGKIGDSRGHMYFLVSGYALSALATFGYLFVSSPLHLMLIQVLQGIALALSQPTWLALYDQASGDDMHDGYLWGLSSGMAYIFSGAATALGAVIVYRFSFDVLFISMGTLLVFATVVQAGALWNNKII